MIWIPAKFNGRASAAAILLHTFSLLYFVGQSTLAQTTPSTAPTSGPAVVRKGTLVSEAVAQVSDQVITSREVVASFMMEKATSEKLPTAVSGSKKTSPIDRSTWVLKPGTEAFQKHLAQIILEQVIQLEAESFSIGEVSHDELEAFRKHLQEAVKGWEPWTKLDMGSAEIEKIISRKLRAKNFLQFKMETSGVQISDEEAKSYFEKNRVKFGNLPFSQFKEGIKEVLAQEQLQEKLKDWFEILKRKYRVKFLGQGSST